MVLRRAFLFLLIASAFAKDQTAAFTFRQVDYFHRWTGGTQHEFTPANQDDLDHWTDMMTINVYPDVAEGEKLAGAANAVLGNYKSHGGKILKTDSVPATSDRPAEHFIAVLFTQAGFAEAAFARFKLHEGKGYSFVYSHRFYGKNATEETKAWLKANGEETETALMEWKPNLEKIPAD